MITNTKFYYWYELKNYNENKLPLGYFDLKNLYLVEVLTDGEIGGMENVFCIQVSSWYKKDQIKGTRKFYVSASNKVELYNWVITLNFLRVKAIYDEFTKNFGLINLPLPHEVKGKVKLRTKYKFKNKKAVRIGNTKTSYGIYASMARKSIINRSTVSYDSIKEQSFNINKYTNQNTNNDFIADESESLEKIAKCKDILDDALKYGMPSFIGFVQDIIWNVDNVNINDEKIITIPNHLVEFRSLEVLHPKNMSSTDL